MEKKIAPVRHMIGNTEYTDDMARQSSIAFRFYSQEAGTKAHKKGCPGCDPLAPSDPNKAIWFVIEAKWRAKGEPPSCPIERQKWYREQYQNRSWWVEERDGKAHYDPAG